MSSGADSGPTSLLHMAGLSQGQPGSQQGTCARSLRTGTSEAWKPPSLDLHTYPDQEKLLPREVVMIPEDINAARPACRVPRGLSPGAAVLALREEGEEGAQGADSWNRTSSLSHHPPSLTWRAPCPGTRLGRVLKSHISLDDRVTSAASASHP